MQKIDQKVPENSVKSFVDVKFYTKKFVYIPQVKIPKKLSSKDNIIKNRSIFIKTTLAYIDNEGRNFIHSICNNLCYNFIEGITKGNWS